MPVEEEVADGVFRLTEDELKKAHEWMADQLQKVPGAGTFGDRFTFCFCPSGIGTPAWVIDNRTKEEIDLTEDVEW